MYIYMYIHVTLCISYKVTYKSAIFTADEEFSLILISLTHHNVRYRYMYMHTIIQ